MTHRTLLLLLMVTMSLAGFGQDERAMTREADALRERARQLMPLRQSTPQRYVDETLKLAAAYTALGKRYAAVSQSKGVRGEAVTLTARAAAAARYELKQPKKAIELYLRAAGLQAEEFPQSKGLAYDEEIADIQQFDLAGRAAAAATMTELRKVTGSLGAAGESAPLFAWKTAWLDAEIAFLQGGKRFDGVAPGNLLPGFFMHLYYGAGTQFTGTGLIDPALRTIEHASPAEVEALLARLPPGHSTFLQTWSLLSRVTSQQALSRHLSRNDPAGYWTASLLTLAAVADRDAASSPSDVVGSLVRNAEGKPTALALLARAWAKGRTLPTKGVGRVGH